jgi:hypothetical protein
VGVSRWRDCENCLPVDPSEEGAAGPAVQRTAAVVAERDWALIKQEVWLVQVDSAALGVELEGEIVFGAAASRPLA